MVQSARLGDHPPDSPVARIQRAQIAPLRAKLPAIGTEKRDRDETDVRGLMQILGDNYRKIALSTFLSLLLSLAYLATATPAYTTSASLFIDPRTRKVVTEDIIPGGFGSDLALVESQLAILTSDAVLNRVVEKLNLANDPEYAPSPSKGFLSKLKSYIIPKAELGDPASTAVGSLARSIKAKRAQKTYIVDLDVTASSPVKAARVAEAVVEAYLADQAAAKSAEAKRANALIDSRLSELREQVRLADTRVDDFKKANKILTSEGGVVNEQQLSRLNGELITARAVAAENKARFDQIQTALTSGAGPEVLPDAVRSGLIQRLREQYAQVARREAALASQLQPRHPVLIDVRSQLNEVKVQINAELKRVATAAQSEYQIGNNRERELSSQLEKAKEDVSRTNTAQIKLRELDQEVNASRELLKTFLARAKETSEQKNISTPDARVITPPSVPSRPSKPLAFLVLGLGLLGGLGLGIASALLTDHLDRTLRNANDLSAETGLQTVSEIPRLSAATSVKRSGNGERIEAAQFSDVLSAVAAINGQAASHYRQGILRLLAKIKSHQRPGRPHTVMLVSSRTNAGNSATTLATAYAAALSGERVLLVDATSTNPELSAIFATSLKPHTAIVLDNKDHLNQITTRDLRSGLAFLPIALADLRTLKSQQRRRLISGLNGLSQNFDLIFIDAGGVLEDEAAACLIPAADQILFVARQGSTSRSEIAETLELLEPGSDRITGAVLTPPV